ncbi:polysaccharide pyruvyl transferase family protein [Agromyces aerolatus]|uniref:polysaccharide pyruvyl transferase family protein n=1 Tax=Agromyces sp. LY-1074 TaxID=3074080 RepID=UPI00285CCDD9|nr:MULTISPECIES: polysaccharide pyruvyl transferase family protein [unclassified Agromyces]MDR5701479.1 polysaccharide pyruvyl transferase family protein [Agromyces sp. LY-1074]MDR5704454.1 polysaccharide pyruvyl transferase family protein [Agromyces sp. LY-1358]
MATQDGIALESLRAATRAALREAIGPAHEVVLLDLPTHMNVGDTMILRGELEHLRRLGIRPSYLADRWRYRPEDMRALARDAPILLHGGGNFGDVWPEFQAFREEIVDRHQSTRIIQLSQSVYFSSASAAQRADRILGSHPNFLLMVRDWDSFERAKRLLPSVRAQFVPDMAFGLQLEVTGPDRNGPITLLAREDHESTGSLKKAALEALPEQPRTIDWGLNGVPRLEWSLRKIPAAVSKRVASARGRQLMYPIVASQYASMFDLNMKSGVDIVRSARLLLTDRLHAHVLACLLGVPHIVTDNSNGKVGAIYRAYTSEFTSATFAKDVDDLGIAIQKALRD